MISNRLAKFVVDFDLGKALPSLNIEHFRKLILDAVVCGIAGTKGPFADPVLRAYRSMSDSQQSTILCSDKKTTAPHAAFINSFFARNYTFDDVFEPGVLHPGAAIIMSSLAVGEWLNSSMQEATEAMVPGYEVATRISKAMNPSHYDKGFHPTGTCNTVGVAAAASKLLHLDENRTRTALRLAADQACGFRQYQLDGNIANSAFHGAKAAENGVIAALLAKEGFADPGETLSGKFGLLNCMAGQWSEKDLMDGLGTSFLFLETSLKPYPSCRYMHGAVDAVAKCKNKNRLKAIDIERVNIYTFKMAFEEGNRPLPKTVLDAQFSIHHNVATYLAKDAIGIEDFTEEAIREKRIQELGKKITVFEDEELTRRYPAEWPFRAEIIEKDGQRFIHEVFHPPGSPSNPLEPGEFEKKCILLLEPILGETKAKALLEQLGRIEQIATVPRFFELLKRLTLGAG